MPLTAEKRIPQLDGVRGIAIIAVVAFHYSLGMWGDGAPPITFPPHTIWALIGHIVAFGWSGVDLFFVLSGFLIGGILIDHTKSENYFRSFYIRRALRILPLYFIFIAFALPLYPSDADMFIEGHLAPIGWYLILSVNIWMVAASQANTWLGHIWSLGVEEQFYLCLPLLLWIIPAKNRRIFLLAGIGTALLLRCGLIGVGVKPLFLHFSFPTRMDTLFVGVLCADLIRDEAARKRFARNLRQLYFGFASCGIAVLAMAKAELTMGTVAMATFGYSLLATFYGLFLLIAVLEKRGPVAWLTNCAPLRRMGLLAYFVFLFHVPIAYSAFKTIGSRLELWSASYCLLLAACAVATIILADLSWRYFEGPLVAFGHRLAPYKDGKRFVDARIGSVTAPRD